MNGWKYLKDHWRAIIAFSVGLGFTISYLLLVLSVNRIVFAWPDILYAVGLGCFPLLIYFLADYWRRRPFYLEARNRLQASTDITSVPAIEVAGTQEQEFTLELLNKYQFAYANEVKKMEESRQFYELFVTQFAHQMKTPVSVIQLLENELRNAATSPVATAFFQDLAEQFGEERSRIDNALNMMIYTARLSAFSFDARMESIDLLKVIRSVINQHKVEWIHTKLFPRIESASEQVPVTSDQKWLRFLCEQIIRNALQYGSGDSSSEFVIRVTNDSQQVRIDFIDQGIGIPPEDLGRVFEPFYTGSNGRTHSRATGMGLYLVKEVVTRLGHQIALQSKLGAGTTVSLFLATPSYFAEVLGSDSVR